MALVSTIEVEYGDFNGCCWFSATVVYCCTTYILWLIGSALHWYIAVQVTYCDLLVFSFHLSIAVSKKKCQYGVFGIKKKCI